MSESNLRRLAHFFSPIRRIKQSLLPGSQGAHSEKAAVAPEIEQVPEPPAARSSIAAPTGPPFTDFDLPEPILSGIREAGFERCTLIQAQCLPLSLHGRDIAGQAQTGTGKTAAFLITALDRLLRLEDGDALTPSALIIAPTRELALQIYHDALLLGRHAGLRIGVVFGGVDYKKQAHELKQGLDMVIGTPGRIIDYMKQRVLKVKRVKVLVIDEADRMFDMGFIRDLRYILKRLPHHTKRQSMLFSATLNYRVLELAYEYMNHPEEIYIEPQERTVDTVEQCVFHVGFREKFPLLLGIMKREPWHRVLIFCNTKAGVESLAAKLIGNGYPAEGITGDLPQRQRLRLMERFKSGDLKILVATDVASRGIHVEDVTHVINYDVPQDREDYVHRIGRTARGGKSGKAITLACERWVWHLEPIEKFIDMKIPVVWFDETWLEHDRSPSRRGISRPWPRSGQKRRRQGERPRSVHRKKKTAS
jgi:ATP-dependent RNA helicase RhlB